MARKIFLLAGAAGSGKSTWIAAHPELADLTHSWDAERRKCGYITYTLDNQPALALSQNTSAESKAIRRVNDCVEENMRHGNTVFIDNMNVLLRNMKTFLELRANTVTPHTLSIFRANSPSTSCIRAT